MLGASWRPLPLKCQAFPAGLIRSTMTCCLLEADVISTGVLVRQFDDWFCCCVHTLCDVWFAVLVMIDPPDHDHKWRLMFRVDQWCLTLLPKLPSLPGLFCALVFFWKYCMYFWHCFYTFKTVLHSILRTGRLLIIIIIVIIVIVIVIGHGGSQSSFCTSPGILSRSFFTTQRWLALCVADCLMWAEIRWRGSESRSWLEAGSRTLRSTPVPLWLPSW